MSNMTIKGDELLNAAELLAREKNIMVTVKNSLLGGAMAGVTSVIGGLVMGPIGIAVGGAAGGLVGYATTKNKFKPLHEVIANDLTTWQRNQLIEHLRRALEDFDIADLVKLTSFLMASSSLQNAFLTSLVAFVQNELHMSVKQ